MLKKIFLVFIIIVCCFLFGLFYTENVKPIKDDVKTMECDVNDIKKFTSICEITISSSPNYTSRIKHTKPEMIILHHTISDTASSAVSWFEDKNSKVSAHFIIDKDGSITYMVPITKSAWHAGLSYVRVPHSEAKFQSAKGLINHFKKSSDEDIELNIAKLLGESDNTHLTDQQKEMVKEIILSDEEYLTNLKREDTIELPFLNDYSIGIELVNTGNEHYPQEQMSSVKNLVLYLMNRFKIEKNMIFSHFEIGTIEYDNGVEGYILRKPDPSKYLNWEYLEKNGIGIHPGDHISSSDFGKLLYKYGDNNNDIIHLKKRLNNIGYKIEPFVDQKGKIHFPEDNIEYASEFDDKLALVILQFSSRYLPENLRKDLPFTRLEVYDVLPQSAVSHLKNEVLSVIDTFMDTIPASQKEKYQNIINVNVSNAFDKAMETINNYYQGNLRYTLGYHSTWSKHLTEPILLSLRSLIKELSNKGLSDLYSEFDFSGKLNNKLSEFYLLIGKEFKRQFHVEFMPKVRNIGWSQLHESSLLYIENELLKYKSNA